MTTNQVQSRGIYHGLPVFSPDIKNLTAIITGANGISGQHMLRVLAQAPERWTKIYCLSRRPPAIPDGLPPLAEHIPLDFLQDPDEIAKTLKERNITADYVFFYSYIPVSPTAAEEMYRVNVKLLSNFCDALSLAEIKPKRFMLQTGAKYYGVHLGPTKVPQEESIPRTTLSQPNFYYGQEDFLFEWCKAQRIQWTIVMPACIFGAVPEAAHNICAPVAVYAAVKRHLKQPLEYPGDLRAWETPQDQSSAMLNGYLAEWTVLCDAAGNERFNACDGSTFTWGAAWEKVAAWFGIECGMPVLDEKAYKTMQIMPFEETPRGFGPQITMRSRFSLVEWAKSTEVQQAWSEIATKHGLVNKDLGDLDHVFSFPDYFMSGDFHMHYNMDKARKLGFFGTVNTLECMLEVFSDFVKLKMLPPFPGAKFPYPTLHEEKNVPMHSKSVS